MAYVVFMSYSKFLIGVKYHNWRQTLDFYLLFAILLANLLKPKLQACNLQTGQSISYVKEMVFFCQNCSYIL